MCVCVHAQKLRKRVFKRKSKLKGILLRNENIFLTSISPLSLESFKVRCGCAHILEVRRSFKMSYLYIFVFSISF